MKLLFLDIETTGFDRQWDNIIEIAAILYDEATQKEVKRFHEYIKPKKSIPLQITEITGITNAQVANCRSEDDVLDSLVAFIDSCGADRIVGHNMDAFDWPFISARLGYYFKAVPKVTTIDTLKIARANKVPTSGKTATGNPSYKQEFIAAALGIEYDAHSAIEDVRALIEIYKKIKPASTGETITQKEEIDRKRIKLGF